MTKYKDTLKSLEGTSFKGYLLANYNDLVSVFSRPITDIDDCKTDAEWIIDTPYGVTTIYNYKNGKRYLGKNGLDTSIICKWHVGAKKLKSFEWIKTELHKSIIERYS